jgi:hypothetical protein
MTANVSKLIFGAAIAAASLASPALAQYASQSDRSISLHHSKHLSISSHRLVNSLGAVQSGPTFAPPPTEIPSNPQSWVGDPAGRPYVYIPGMASGGQ